MDGIMQSWEGAPLDAVIAQECIYSRDYDRHCHRDWRSSVYKCDDIRGWNARRKLHEDDRS